MNRCSRIALALGQLAPFLLCASYATAQKVLDEGVKDLAAQLAPAVAKEPKRKIAVISFREVDGRPTVLGAYIAEELTTDLFSAGSVDIVERGMLDKVMGELKLNQSGVIDPGTAKQLGKVAGVDAIVSGTITELESYVALNCRVIDTQTGQIVKTAGAKIVKNGDLVKIMGAPLAPAPRADQNAGQSPASGGSGSAAQAREAAKHEVTSSSVHLGDWIIVVRGCFKNGDTAECTGLVNNRGPRAWIDIYPHESRVYAVDNLGVQTNKVLELKVGSQGSKQELETDVPTNFTVALRGVSPDATSITLVMLCDLGWGTPRHSQEKVVFRNITLQSK